MIFVLEDDVARIKWFNFEFGKSNVIHTPSPIEGIFKLTEQSNSFDTIYLDFDLGGHNNLWCAGGGIVVARFLSRRLTYVNTPIIIHSNCVEGANEIFNILKHTHNNVRVLPFAQLMNERMKTLASVN